MFSGQTHNHESNFDTKRKEILYMNHSCKTVHENFDVIAIRQSRIVKD